MKKPTSLFAILASASIASAAITVSEPFDYDTGVLGTTATNGTGQTGDWQRDNDTTSSATLQVFDSVGWSAPSPYGTPSSKGAGDGDGAFLLNNSISAEPTSETQIYFSFLYRQTADPVENDSALVGFGNATNPDMFRFQVLNGGDWRAVDNGDFAQAAAPAAGDYLIVGRITLSDSDDSIRLWGFDSSATSLDEVDENAFAATGGGDNVSGNIESVEFRNFGNSDIRVGEFKIGESWEDVTAVPEPSTYALLAGLATLGLLLIRHRRKN